MDESQIQSMKLGAAVDQMSAVLTEFSRTLGAYLRALMGQGFYRSEALKLVEGYQATTLRNAFEQQKGSKDHE